MIAPVDVSGIRIETERLILRPWQVSDAEDFYAYASVDGVGQMCGWLPHKDLEESRRILASFIQEKKTFALEYKANGTVIGSIGLEERDADLGLDERLAGREIGYVLRKEYWGQGLMPEAVSAVIDHCFLNLNFDWLTCGHFIRNDRSRRVVEKCGFRYIRDVIHQTRFGTQEPTKLYLMDRNDHIFLKMNAPFDVTGCRLQTERLLLRPVEEGDLPGYHRICQIPSVAQYAGWEVSASLEDTKKRLEQHLSRKETFAILAKDTNEFLGSISVQGRNWPDYPIAQTLKGRELGFELHPDYWGKGIMPEAVRAVSELCFQKLGFDFLSAGYFAGNERSRRVMEKCGFQFLFESDLTLPSQKYVHVITFIRYKET